MAPGTWALRYPAVRLDLQLNDQQVDLLEGGFDLAVRIATLEDSQLVARRLATARQVVCGSPECFARRGVPEHPDDLLRHDCIVYTYGHDGGKWRFRAPGAERDVLVPVNGPVHTNNGIVEKAEALGGLGLALLPTFYVAEELRSGALRAVLTHFPPSSSASTRCIPSARAQRRSCARSSISCGRRSRRRRGSRGSRSSWHEDAGWLLALCAARLLRAALIPASSPRVAFPGAPRYS